MPNPITNFKDSFGTDLGNKLITKEYLTSVYPQIANQLTTPELWSWGAYFYQFAQLGTNSAAPSSTPVTTFAGGSNWKQVACGLEHTIAIKTDGTLWTWGRNNSGQLGVNDTSNRSTPVTTFAGGTNWRTCAAGYRFCAAIKTDGTLWTWGRNSYGQLGNNNTSQRNTPVTTFAGGTNWKQVDCARGTFYEHMAAVKTDGTLWAWGYNPEGQLGNNNTSQRNTPVTTFAGGTNWKQVSCSGGNAAVKTDGTLWVWGWNAYSQLGTNDNVQRLTPVTTFAGGTNWKQVAVGDFHALAIKTDGTLWAWGQNGGGYLGDATTARRSTPVTTFSGGTNWKQCAASNRNSAAIKTDGTLWVWGTNTYIPLGTNNTSTPYTPVTTFLGGSNWRQISTNHDWMSGIRSTDDTNSI
jgi:alpha-tubulin suppressor-like RCC1 family protein